MISEDGFSSIFKFLPVPGLVLLPDEPSYTILAINNAYLDLSNIQEEEIAGKGYFDVFPGKPGSSVSELKKSFQKVLRSGKTDVVPLSSCEVYHCHREASCTNYLEVENIPVPDKAGNIAYIIHTIKDITGSIETAARMQRADALEHLEREVLELNFQKNISIKELLTRYLLGIESLFPDMQGSILRAEDGHLHVWASPSLPPEYLGQTENLPIEDNVGSCGTAAYLKQLVVAKDIANDPRWKEYKQIALKYNLRACWSYPIVNSEGDVMATFGMYYRQIKEPDAEERKIIHRATSILKMIIENRQHLQRIEETSLLMEQAQQLAGFGNWSWSLESNEVNWSNSLLALYGIPEDRKRRKYEDYLQLVHKDDVKRVSAYLSEALSNPEEIKYEARMVRPDGQLRHHMTWAILRRDEQGEPHRLVGACLDITESKLIQERLRVSESRLRNLVDSQTNYVIRTDLDGKYTYYNHRYKEDFGWLHPEGSLLGLDSMSSVLPHHHKRVYDTAELCQLDPNNVYSVELDKYERNGNTKATIWHFICLTDLSGKPAEIQCIGIDNTERKHAEDELKASHERYRELFHLSPQPMWVYELDTLNFLDVNDAAIKHYGYSKEEFLTMNLTGLRDKEEVPALLDAVRQSRGETGLIHHGTFKHRKKNGEITYVDMHSNVIAHGDKVTQIALANDVTERLHYVNAIEEQNKRFKEIAWMQSHVMRAPVARIMSLVDLINNHDNPDHEQRELLEYILQSAHELDRIVKDISAQTRH